jgi:hypothetical protein
MDNPAVGNRGLGQIRESLNAVKAGLDSLTSKVKALRDEEAANLQRLRARRLARLGS